MQAISIKAYTEDDGQIAAITAFLKDLKVAFEVKKESTYTDDEPNKEEVVANLKAGFEEMRRFKQGNLKTTSANDFA